MVLTVSGIVAAEAVNPILPAANELVYGTLAFLILFFFLYKKVFPNVNRALDERADRIRSDLDRAEQAREEAQKLLDDYKEQLQGARDEARKVVEDAKEAAQSTRQDLIAKAESDAERVLDRAEQEIRSQRDQAFNDLRREIGRLAVQVADRIVGDSLDEERHLRLVDEYIDELNEDGTDKVGGAGRG